jgi:uncharacterized protein (TIGR00266 family)
MDIKILGGPAFGYAHIDLQPGETIITESGAMASMSPLLSLKAKLNGGFIQGLLRKLFGGESLFISYYNNPSPAVQRLTITQPTPGAMMMKRLNNETIFLQPTAFIACEPTVKMSLKFAGFTSFIAREGLFKIQLTGTGNIILGAFGEMLERDLKGELIVDTGHLVGYGPGIKLKTQLSGGIISSLTSGEGLVTRLEGNGKVWLQTRNLGGMAAFINRFF